MPAAPRAVLHAWVVLVTFQWSWASHATPQLPTLPLPPVQTPAQLARMKILGAKAEVASKAATDKVLAFFDEPDFRDGLRDCCGDVAGLSSQELLERFRKELKATELAHAFQVSAGDGFFGDLTIPLVEKYGFFLNQWQVNAVTANQSEGVLPIINLAEEGIFGCEKFKVELKPTWAEAADRMVYTAQNIRQLDTGSLPEFGNVTAVFSNAYVKDMVAITPVDTGIWTFTCDAKVNSTAFAKNMSAHYHCSDWDRSVATLEHLDHIILPNLRLTATSENTTMVEKALSLFRRSPLAGRYMDLPPISGSMSGNYYEANLLGNPRFREGVKFLIGNFPALFGTEGISQLYMLAVELQLPLIWAYGTGSEKPSIGTVSPGNRRFLDPVVPAAGVLVNATMKPTAQDTFAAVFREVAEARRHGTTDSARWNAWWTTLEASLVRVAPLTASACSSADFCIGTDASTGDCICRAPPPQPVWI